jgi:hypothetical protein
MKFSFQKDQVLTTYAYEVSVSTKSKIRRHHFVHVAKPTETGQIKYFSFPRMIHFNEQDPLKVVAMKVFKVMRPLLTQTAFITDPAFSAQSEVEAYQTVFASSSPPPYEMVLIMKDGTRWKLDPNIN